VSRYAHLCRRRTPFRCDGCGRVIARRRPHYFVGTASLAVVCAHCITAPDVWPWRVLHGSATRAGAHAYIAERDRNRVVIEPEPP
jgi:hypothetical protein